MQAVLLVRVGTILMDFSKAYDCLPHDLMVATLEAYDLARESLQLIMII